MNQKKNQNIYSSIIYEILKNPVTPVHIDRLQHIHSMKHYTRAISNLASQMPLYLVWTIHKLNIHPMQQEKASKLYTIT